MGGGGEGVRGFVYLKWASLFYLIYCFIFIIIIVSSLLLFFIFYVLYFIFLALYSKFRFFPFGKCCWVLRSPGLKGGRPPPPPPTRWSAND